jgi:hypothetical protein
MAIFVCGCWQDLRFPDQELAGRYGEEKKTDQVTSAKKGVVLNTEAVVYSNLAYLI